MRRIIDIIIELINRLLSLMWKGAFDAILDASPVVEFVESKRRQIESIDPKRFEPNQVASLFGIPAFMATFLCSLAVRQGRFDRLAPDDGEVRLYKLTLTEAQ
jgi:hypothetical protein